MEDKPRRIFNYAEILPNNDRVRRKKEVEERDKIEKERMDMENQKKKFEEMNLEELSKKQKIEKELKQRQILENEKLNIQERKAKLQMMEGNLSTIIKQLVDNTSPYELSFSEIDLDPWDFTSLMLFLADNLSLLTLNLSRKNITDEQAKEIAEMLKKNKKLRRMELEGNFIGPEGLIHIADALKVNKTLRYIDLENNNLTSKGQEDKGIKAICDSLTKNSMLVSLNISNNSLNSDCGTHLKDCLKLNSTLIHLEIFDNQRFEEFKSAASDTESKFIRYGLGINQISDINDAVVRNKKKYDELRLNEWKERKMMTNDENETDKYDIYTSHKKIEEDIKAKDKLNVENFYMEHFKKHTDALEKEFINGVDEFFVATKARLEKKPKRRPPKKK